MAALWSARSAGVWEDERPKETALVVVAEFVPWMGPFAWTAHGSTAKRLYNAARGRRASRRTLGGVRRRVTHPNGVPQSQGGAAAPLTWALLSHRFAVPIPWRVNVTQGGAAAPLTLGSVVEPLRG
mgnify:CR=1 FL=1